MKKSCRYKTAIKFKNIELDEFVVMPNHFHGVIFIVGADLRVCPDINNDDKNKGEHTGSPLHKIVQWFKTAMSFGTAHLDEAQFKPGSQGRCAESLWTY